MINVISIHGVRSKGKWQEELQEYIKDSGRTNIKYMPYNYGWIPAIFCVIPFFRKHYIKKFKKWSKHQFSFLHGQNNVIVAHSFGTYIAFHALKQIKWLKIKKLLLFGSVLHCREDFDDMIPDIIKEVYNFHSKTDEICMMNPLGHSGAWGFRNTKTKSKVWKKHPYKNKKIINHKCLITEHTQWFPKSFSKILKLVD